MTVKTHCVCGENIRRTYGNPSGLPHDGRNSLRVRVSLISRLIDEHPSRINLCSSCRHEFANNRQKAGESEKNPGGAVRICDFCQGKVGGTINKAVKGPLGAVKSWSGRKERSSDSAFEKLDVCAECQQSFIEFVERKREKNQ